MMRLLFASPDPPPSWLAAVFHRQVSIVYADTPAGATRAVSLYRPHAVVLWPRWPLLEPWVALLQQASNLPARSAILRAPDSASLPFLNGFVPCTSDAAVQQALASLEQQFGATQPDVLEEGAAVLVPDYFWQAWRSLQSLSLEVGPRSFLMDALKLCLDGSRAAGLFLVVHQLRLELQAPQGLRLPAGASSVLAAAEACRLPVIWVLPYDGELWIFPLGGEGALCVFMKQPQPPSQWYACLLLADALRMRLQLLLQEQRSREALSQLQAISDVSRAAAAGLGLERVLTIVAQTALRQILSAQAVIVHLLDESRQFLIPSARVGAELLAEPIPVSEAGPLKEALVRRAPVCVGPEEALPVAVARKGPVLVAPIQVGEAPAGTIAAVAVAEGSFEPEHERLLQALASQTAIALESARLHRQAQRADELAALYELSQSLSSSLELRQTVTSILGSMKSLTLATIAEVRLVSAEGELGPIITLEGSAELGPGDRYRLSVHYPTFVARSRQPLLVYDTVGCELEDDFCRCEPPAQVRSYLGLPLIAGQSLVGIVSLGGDRPGTFTPDDLRLLQIASGQAATALQNARLYEEAQRRMRQAEALADASRRLVSTLDRSQAIQSTLESVLSTMPLAEHAFFFFRLGDSGRPELESARPRGPLYDGAAAIWQWCADGSLIRGQPFVVEDTIQHGFSAAVRDAPHSVVAVPVRGSQDLFGVLGIDSAIPGGLSAEDGRLLEAFASQLATSLQNIRLFERLSAAYRDLAASTEVLRAVFQGIGDGLYVVSRDDQLLMVNEAEAARLGYRPQELIGRSYRALYHRSEGECEHCCVIGCFQSGERATSVFSEADGHGSLHWREVTVYPILDDSGRVDRVVTLARDVTDQRRMEASLYESSKLAAIGQLAASIAHEINNPLTVIAGNAEVLLLDRAPEDPDRDSLEMILRAARRAANTIERVLELASAHEVEQSEVDLVESIQEAISLVNHPLRKARVELSLEVAPGIPTVLGSRNQLKVAWMNLLLNAKDAIQAAGPEKGLIRVRIYCPKPDEVAVSVEDNGTGIDPGALLKLGQPFFTTKPRGQALGLGLYNVYNIVRQHGGRVEVSSEPGKGASFTVILPADTGQEPR